ncbi:MAG: TIGR02757 family protein [Mariniphaga sp.]|nr:TIGR02757 family protein [Mariniphaga sp.]
MKQAFNIKDFLEEKAALYNRPSFIQTDPIQVPKQFSKKENIEIAGFLTATIAWGQRTTIIKNSLNLIERMDNNPYKLLMDLSENDLSVFEGFKHRTFNSDDCKFFIRSLKNIYSNHGGLQKVFEKGFQQRKTIKNALTYFYQIFFEIKELPRTRKHVSNVMSGSSAKRLNMFLRWMVRNDNKGVDFGIWNNIPQSALMLPLDIHTGNVARKLGILSRKQNDWKAVEELTSILRKYDPNDPIKYDFALFGLGAFEKF